MTNHDPLSRPEACAAALGHQAADAHRFTNKRVLLTGEAGVLATANGRWIAEDALRLLVRICRHVDVWLPEPARALNAELDALARTIQFTHPVPFLAQPSFTDYDAILSVGFTAPTANATVVNSHGWVARVSSVSVAPVPCDFPNPIAALAAASLGVAEVFKRLVNLRPERGPFLERMSFSVLALEESHDPGPALPQLDLRTALVAGQGAIGNGVVLLVGQLAPRGHVLLLDRQVYGSENLGTCVLLGPRNVGKSKAQVNDTWLKARGVAATSVDGEIETLLVRFGRDLPRPRIVMGALDNVEARHALQELWPDVLVDGAIGDFACQAAIHVWDTDMACLKCLFEQPLGADPTMLASAETGLAGARLADVDSLVTIEDVRAAPEDKRAYLQQHVGRRICSVVSEAMHAKISRDAQSRTFSPSVPFVATMSASLSVAAAVRHQLGLGSAPARYYMDLLVGPATAEHFNERAKPACFCMTRRGFIRRYREACAAE